MKTRKPTFSDEDGTENKENPRILPCRVQVSWTLAARVKQCLFDTIDDRRSLETPDLETQSLFEHGSGETTHRTSVDIHFFFDRKHHDSRDHRKRSITRRECSKETRTIFKQHPDSLYLQLPLPPPISNP
jgi:hypothetical protein